MRVRHGGMPSPRMRAGSVPCRPMPARPFSVRRRAWLGGAAAWLAGASGAGFAQPSPPVTVGVDAALLASGLAPRLAAALLHDTGLRIAWQGGPSGAVLERLERGELDAALVFDPPGEQALLAQHLVHDRRPVARTALVLVGPAPRRAGRRAASGRADDLAAGAGPTRGGLRAALERIAALGARGQACFVASGEPGGARALEREAWQGLAPPPGTSWWRTAGPGPAAALELARSSRGYALVERGLWQSLGPAAAGLAVVVDGDPALAVDYHVMRAFRARHPAGRLLVAWLAGPAGQQVVAGFGRGYRSA
jgi:tungstate transport system substrate-binding protein